MARTLGSLENTQKLAHDLLGHLPPGALLVLAGPLGAGKTTLVQALARALGSGAQVSSPTYTLVHEYPTPAGVLVHIDAYRLGDADALFELGLEDYLERARLTAVEWGEGLLTTFPDALVVRLSLHDVRDDDVRDDDVRDEVRDDDVRGEVRDEVRGEVRRAAVTQGDRELV